MRTGVCLFALAALPLSGCMTWSVDETYFFKPQPVAQRAQTVAELKLASEERLTVPGEYSAGMGRIFPNFSRRMPAQITHDFVSLGGERIAISRVRGADAPANEPLIVMCSGQSGSRHDMGWYFATKSLPWGEVLLVDYPGYGDSSGQPTAASMAAFQTAFAGYVDALVDGRPLVLWGHSLGGPVCAQIASESRRRTPLSWRQPLLI